MGQVEALTAEIRAHKAQIRRHREDLRKAKAELVRLLSASSIKLIVRRSEEDSHGR